MPTIPAPIIRSAILKRICASEGVVASAMAITPVAEKRVTPYMVGAVRHARNATPRNFPEGSCPSTSESHRARTGVRQLASRPRWPYRTDVNAAVRLTRTFGRRRTHCLEGLDER